MGVRRSNSQWMKHLEVMTCAELITVTPAVRNATTFTLKPTLCSSPGPNQLQDCEARLARDT